MQDMTMAYGPTGEATRLSVLPSPPSGPSAEPERLRLSADQRQYLARWVCSSIKAARNDGGRRYFLQRLAQWNRAYEGIAAPKNFPWPEAANVWVPMTAWTVDSVWSRLARATLYAEPVVLVRPVNPHDETHVEAAKAQEEWLQHILVSVLNFKGRGRSLTHLAVREGTGVTQLSWRERTVRNRGVSYQGDRAVVMEEEKRFNGPELDIIGLEDFELIPPYARSVEEAVGAMRRLYVRKEALRRGQRMGYYQNVAEVKTPAFRDQFSAPVRASQDLAEGISGGPRQPTQEEEQEFEIYEGRWFYDVDGDGLDEKILVTVGLEDEVLLRAERFPYLHGEDYFHAWRVIQRPNRFYGQSYPDKVASLQEETNTIHNQRLDALTITLAPVIKARRTAMIGDGSSRSVQFYPGAFLWMDDLTDVEVLQFPPLNPGAFQEEATLQRYQEQLTGITQQRMGLNNTGRRPLGETQQVMAEGNVRLDEVVATFGDTLPSLCYQIVQLYRQYRGQFPEMGAMDFLDVPVVYLPNGNLAATNMDWRKQQKMQFAAFLLQDPFIAQNPQRRYALERWLAQEYDVRDVDGILGQEPPGGQVVPPQPGLGGSSPLTQASDFQQQQQWGNVLGQAMGTGG